MHVYIYIYVNVLVYLRSYTRTYIYIYTYIEFLGNSAQQIQGLFGGEALEPTTPEHFSPETPNLRTLHFLCVSSEDRNIFHGVIWGL